METPGASFDGFLGYGVIGLLVGVVPVALGLLWLPSLRRADERWLSAFLALTGGLLTFLGIEALAEAFERQSALPEPLAGTGLVLLGVAVSYLTMTFLGSTYHAGEGAQGVPLRSRSSSRSASACTTSAKGSRSARPSRSAG